MTYAVGKREKIDATAYPTQYRGAWGWHRYGRYYYQTEAVHRTYTEGTLNIDIFGVSTKQPVGHGWATKTILSTGRILAEI